MPSAVSLRFLTGSVSFGLLLNAFDGSPARAADSSMSDLLRIRGEAKRQAAPLMKMDPIAWGREKTQGYRALFSGRTLDGWREVGAKYGQWRALEGALRYTGGGATWLRTETTHDDYVLRLQWRLLKPGGNAALLLRTGRDGVTAPASATPVRLSDAATAGSVTVGGQEVKAAGGSARPALQWNDFEVTANGSQIIVKLNGREVSRTLAASRPVGFIGLQGKGTPFEVRNVRIKETSWRPLYNGKDLSNWMTGTPGHWTPAPNGVLASDGKGDVLNTRESFAAYDLRFDWRIVDPKARGGVLYRGGRF